MECSRRFPDKASFRRVYGLKEREGGSLGRMFLDPGKKYQPKRAANRATQENIRFRCSVHTLTILAQNYKPIPPIHAALSTTAHDETDGPLTD